MLERGRTGKTPAVLILVLSNLGLVRSGIVFLPGTLPKFNVLDVVASLGAGGAAPPYNILLQHSEKLFHQLGVLFVQVICFTEVGIHVIELDFRSARGHLTLFGRGPTS